MGDRTKPIEVRLALSEWQMIERVNPVRMMITHKLRRELPERMCECARNKRAMMRWVSCGVGRGTWDVEEDTPDNGMSSTCDVPTMTLLPCDV